MPVITRVASKREADIVEEAATEVAAEATEEETTMPRKVKKVLTTHSGETKMETRMGRLKEDPFKDISMVSTSHTRTTTTSSTTTATGMRRELNMPRSPRKT